MKKAVLLSLLCLSLVSSIVLGIANTQIAAASRDFEIVDEELYFGFSLKSLDTERSTLFFKDLLITWKKEGISLSCDTVATGLSFLEIYLSGQFQNINSLTLTGYNASLKDIDGNSLAISELNLIYSGNLQDLMTAFTYGYNPQKAHSLKCTMKGIKAGTQRNYENYYFGSVFTVIDQISFSASYSSTFTFNGRLTSSFGNITLDSVLDVNENYIDRSVIKKATLTVANLSDILEKAVLDAEGKIGRQFPRQGGNIVLEVQGTIREPLVRGWDY